MRRLTRGQLTVGWQAGMVDSFAVLHRPSGDGDLIARLTQDCVR